MNARIGILAFMGPARIFMDRTNANVRRVTRGKDVTLDLYHVIPLHAKTEEPARSLETFLMTVNVHQVILSHFSFSTNTRN